MVSSPHLAALRKASMLLSALVFFCMTGIFSTAQTISQKLPPEMYTSTDGRILYSGGKKPSGFYDRSLIRSVYLNFTQPDYWTQLTNNYASETNIIASMKIDSTTFPSVGVRFRGNTSYLQIGTSPKKSFAIETDFTVNDQEFMGYKNLKFNNAHQDATFMREVMYNRMAARYTPIAKANYVRLFINNEDWGIYSNIQAIDKNFLEEWFLSNDGARFRATVETTTATLPIGGMMGTRGTMPGGGGFMLPPGFVLPTGATLPGGGGGAMPGGWGDGTAGMNYLGTDTAQYQRYYDLKSSDITQSWQKLISACEVLNNATHSNMSALRAGIDVDKALWFLAVENIFTDDDSYTMKGKQDYYVYYEPETARSLPIEYDGNSSFQITAASSAEWGVFKNANNRNYPLLNKLLAIPELRQRYLSHYRTILDETFTTTNVNAIVDELDKQISALVSADTKKLYPTTQYVSGIPALKQFVATRRAFLLTNSELAQNVQNAPTIASAPFANSKGQQYAQMQANEVATVQATVRSSSGIASVILYHATGVVGNFTQAQMFDDGAHNDGAAGDGVFGGTIPGAAAGTLVRYYVEAIANNAAKSASYLPAGAEHDIFVYTITSAQSTTNATVSSGVVVNEIVASNSNGAKDEAGDLEDWFELYNNASESVDISGLYLTDNPASLKKWRIPAGTSIGAGSYLIFWADEEETEGKLHTNFKLSASGESVILSDSTGRIIDQVTFPALAANIGYARVPNGTGAFASQTPTFRENNAKTTSVRGTQTTNPDDISVFPSPTTNLVNISFADGVFANNVRGQMLEIINVFGQVVMQAQAESRMVLNLEGLSQGVYFVRCGGLGKRFVKN